MQTFTHKPYGSGHRLGLASLALVLAGAVIFGAQVALAQNENATNQSTNRAERLEEARQRICERRETAINRIMDRMALRSQRILNVFTKITERVEAFYTRRGLTVGNYDALVAEVMAKKIAAETQVTALQNNEPFVCADDNPRGIGQAFKEDLKTTNDALKEYKTAVKNLIVGVKSAQGQISSNKNSNANGNSNSNTNTE